MLIKWKTFTIPVHKKKPPRNEWDRNGYIAFWNEWHRLRRKVYGAVSIEDENYYTYLKKVFDAIGNKQKEYNWLITDCVCYPDNPKTADMFRKEYCWINGEKLTELIEKEDFQWIWAVLSAFDKSIANDFNFANGITAIYEINKEITKR